MKAHRYASLLLAALTILGILLTACQPTPAASPVPTTAPPAEPTPWGLNGRLVRVGSDTTYPPFESIDEASNAIVGFDPDLLTWIGQDQNFKVEFVSAAWDGLLPALNAKDYDAVMSAMTITDERKQVVNFSDPYFEVGQVVTVRADNADIKSYKDLTGKLVGVQVGTTGEKAAIEVAMVPEDKLRRYDTIDLAFAALLARDIDAIVADSPTSKNYVGQHAGELIIAGGEGVAAWFTTENYGIAVRKDDTELLNALNAGIANARKAGIVDQLVTKWAIER